MTEEEIVKSDVPISRCNEYLGLIGGIIDELEVVQDEFETQKYIINEFKKIKDGEGVSFNIISNSIDEVDQYLSKIKEMVKKDDPDRQ